MLTYLICSQKLRKETFFFERFSIQRCTLSSLKFKDVGVCSEYQAGSSVVPQKDNLYRHQILRFIVAMLVGGYLLYAECVCVCVCEIPELAEM